MVAVRFRRKSEAGSVLQARFYLDGFGGGSWLLVVADALSIIPGQHLTFERTRGKRTL